ncbi:cupin domain-containing protein [Ancylobacter terrae]|uniref:cupin domain-containing protein n=1 Tax=Ancylobacter sp. sgz301288 TaxID=3342077 RepID=UPI00385B0CF4
MARLITHGDGSWLRLPGRAAREMIGAASGARAVTVREVAIAPHDGSAPPRGPHRHDDFEECIYVLEGEGVTETEAGSYPVAAGDCLLVPAGELHATRNTGTGTLRLLCFFPVADIRAGTREFSSWDEARAAS